MTEQQRKAIEILNRLHAPMVLSEEKAIEDDDYFFLLSFIIDKPHEITVPTPYPVIQPFQPLTPHYGQRWEVICSELG
ncbi:MAG: hypothetical protein PUC18_12865 [Prevotellaceae bacterium]|nr:hypothetical protein [Prevotellaceae bacterium]